MYKICKGSTILNIHIVVDISVFSDITIKLLVNLIVCFINFLFLICCSTNGISRVSFLPTVPQWTLPAEIDDPDETKPNDWDDRKK